MRVRPRIALFAGAIALTVTTAVAVTPFAADAAESPVAATIDVRGTLVVAQADGPAGGSTSYAVELADGSLVRVRGAFSPDARTGASFHGRLSVPGSVARTATSPAAALRIVDRRALTLSVVGSPSVTAVSAAAAPVAHRQFVAAVDNLGVLGQTDATLLGHVTTVGDYWKSESNGAITGLTAPAAVTHYNTALTTTDCGLGNDFFTVIDEAEQKFPGINPFGGSDQLVLFVPDACASGGVVGEGSVGSSFANGGVLIVKAGDGIDGIYGHETGHNYGFAHANALRSGTSLEYYGVYDVMGFTVGGGPGGLPFPMLNALSTPYRVFQGITDVGEIQNVALGDKTQPVHATATIKPRSDATGLRSVSVVDPDTGKTLYLDYRSGGGKDAGSVYAAHGGLDTGSGVLHYAPGVVITSARAGNGVDDLVLDAAGNTSLAAGGTWTNASGSLSVHVNTLTPTGAGAGAAVTVDFAPSTLPFTTVGTPVIGGTVSVGGTVTLDPGTWSPTPTTTTIRWTAAGSPVANTDDKTSFVPAAALVGKQLVATVTESAPGITPRTVQSAAVTVSPGTIAVTANPTVTGTAQVGSTLQGHSGTLGLGAEHRVLDLAVARRRHRHRGRHLADVHRPARGRGQDPERGPAPHRNGLPVHDDRLDRDRRRARSSDLAGTDAHGLRDAAGRGAAAGDHRHLDDRCDAGLPVVRRRVARVRRHQPVVHAGAGGPRQARPRRGDRHPARLPGGDHDVGRHSGGRPRCADHDEADASAGRHWSAGR